MTKKYSEMTRVELVREHELCLAGFEAAKAQQLKLNMARGKPGREQLDMGSDILTVLSTAEDCISGGIDARNYGELAGLPEAKALFAELLGCKAEECLVGGSASLQLMYAWAQSR